MPLTSADELRELAHRARSAGPRRNGVVCGPLVVISGNGYVFDALGVHVSDQGAISLASFAVA
jgi:hypothetical protein